MANSLSLISKVISGAQTGVDMAALRAAKAAGIPTGGVAPKGWRAEDGPQPWLGRDFGLTESDSGDYADRTRANVEAADGTLILTERFPLTGGTALTFRLCTQVGRTRFAVEIGDGLVVDGRLIPRDQVTVAVRQVSGWLLGHGVLVLNVAGPRESKVTGIGVRAEAFLAEVFAAVADGGPS